MVLFRTPSRAFRYYFAFFSSLLLISVLSMVDLYLEANLPAVRPGMRRGYFYLMVLNMGFFGFSLTRLYAAVFERPFTAVWGWIFPVGSVIAVILDFLLQNEAVLPTIVLAYLRIAAPVIAFPIALVFLTPRRHMRSLGDKDLRRYVTWSFIVFALLIVLYAVRQIAGDRNDFFAVYGRTHFGFSFIVANLVSLFYAVKYLAKPAAGAPFSATEEIRLTEGFSNAFNLTPREAVIVAEIIAGKSNREIGRSIEVTEGTVKIFVHNIYKKTGVNNRMALAALIRRETQPN